jgi:hypothetical protein
LKEYFDEISELLLKFKRVCDVAAKIKIKMYSKIHLLLIARLKVKRHWFKLVAKN